MSLDAVPCDLADANAFVKQHHRHNRPVTVARFAIAATDGEKVVGVAIVGNPVARALNDGWTLEVVRVATDGHRNACSFLYGAAWRAARALGWRKLITYTRKEEGGGKPTSCGVASGGRGERPVVVLPVPPSRGPGSEAGQVPLGGSMTREQKIEEAARALLKACEGDSPDSATAWRSLYGAMKNMRAALSAPPTSETVYTTAECPSCGTEVDGIRVLVERDGVLVNPPSAPPSPAEGEREACAKRVEALRDRWKAIYGNGLRPGVVEALDAAANTVRAGEMTTPVDTWDTSPRPPSTSAPPQTDEGACPVCRHPEHGVTLCPVCHDCREECVTVDAASPQTDEGAAMMRTIYGRDLAGVWHATTATYKGAIDTVCGQRGLAAALFSTDPRQHDSIRPEFCDACEGRASRASGRGAVSERDAAAWGRLTAEGDRKIAAAVEAEKDAEIARLRAALAEAERERDEAIEDERAAAAQRLTEARRADAAEASLAQAREVLRAVEWAAFDEMEERYCAACLNYKRVGHAPDCALASALGRGDGGGTT